MSTEGPIRGSDTKNKDVHVGAGVFNCQELQSLGDTELEPVTSCVSSMTSSSKTAFLDQGTAFSPVKTAISKALQWRYTGATMALR